jgi:Photosynthetic reaction centre cytochrome C subunit
MRLSSTPWLAGTLAIFVSALVAVTVNGQVAPAQAPAQAAPAGTAPRQVMVEDVYTNVQLLKGIPAAELWDTMGFIAAATGLNCVGCHVDASLIDIARFADDTPLKRKARQMIEMMNGINKTYYGGARVVSCNSCHNGGNRPEPVPSLVRQYTVPEDDPNTVELVPNITGPSAAEILDKFVAASGGAQRLAAFTSYTGKGTYRGFDTYDQAVPFEVFARAPNQRTLVVHTQNGDSTFTFDGRDGWVAAVDRPRLLMPMTPSEIDSARIEADLAFPASIRTSLSQAQAGFPPTYVNEKKANVIQVMGAARTRTKLFFDAESGMLLRAVRFIPTMIGTVQNQIDYEEYEDVAGVKVPVKWTVTWTSGQAHIELTDVQPNVAIPAARFGQPAPAVLKRVQ